MVDRDRWAIVLSWEKMPGSLCYCWWSDVVAPSLELVSDWGQKNPAGLQGIPHAQSAVPRSGAPT